MSLMTPSGHGRSACVKSRSPGKACSNYGTGEKQLLRIVRPVDLLDRLDDYSECRISRCDNNCLELLLFGLAEGLAAADFHCDGINALLSKAALLKINGLTD